MDSTNHISKVRFWASYIIQGIVVVMFLMGAVTNLMRTEMAVTGAVEMGYPESSVPYLGIVLLISTMFYIFPKTNIIGAALLTAWLGGAVATHIIQQDPIFNFFLPVLFGIFVWLAIWLRDKKVEELFPLRK